MRAKAFDAFSCCQSLPTRHFKQLLLGFALCARVSDLQLLLHCVPFQCSYHESGSTLDLMVRH